MCGGMVLFLLFWFFRLRSRSEWRSDAAVHFLKTYGLCDLFYGHPCDGEQHFLFKFSSDTHFWSAQRVGRHSRRRAAPARSRCSSTTMVRGEYIETRANVQMWLCLVGQSAVCGLVLVICFDAFRVRRCDGAGALRQNYVLLISLVIID